MSIHIVNNTPEISLKVVPAFKVEDTVPDRAYFYVDTKYTNVPLSRLKVGITPLSTGVKVELFQSMTQESESSSYGNGKKGIIQPEYTRSSPEVM